MTECTDCKYINNKFPDTYWCEKFKCETPDFYHIEQEKSFDCSGFKQHESCDNCKHSKRIVYETGTIDSIDYHCLLQNGKMIYSDTLMNYHNYDFPICNIDKWENIFVSRSMNE